MKIYHIISREQWDRAEEKGFYAPDSLAKNGFIHCSSKKQVISTANRRFGDRQDLLLLTINPKNIEAKVIYEDLKGKGEKHPHIYGKLLLGEVESIAEFRPGKGGRFERLGL